MEKISLSYGSLVGKAWDIAKQQRWFWVAIVFMVFLISYLMGKYLGKTPNFTTALNWRFTIIQLIINSFVSLGLINMALKAASGTQAEFADFYAHIDRLPRYILTTFLYWVVAFIGLLLFIIPGVIFLLTYSFYGYFILDKDANIIESLQMSAAITRGARWQIFVFGFVLVLINVAGAIPLGLGLFWTIPTTIIAMALLYKTLLSRLEVSTPVTSK